MCSVVGKMTSEGDAIKLDQWSYTIDGESSHSGHISRFLDSNSYLTESFIVEGETWTPHRKYIWRRVIAGPE